MKLLQLVANAVLGADTVASSAGSGDAGKIAHLDSAGRLDNSVLPLGWGQQRVVITSDVTNSTTTTEDVTGLSFAVLSGITYRFMFWVIFQTAATTTGGRFGVNGPANTLLTVNTVVPISATATISRFGSAYDNLALATAVDTANANRLAVIEGVIIPSADGTVIVRFASEVGSSAVTVQAGSHGQLVAISNVTASPFSESPLNVRTVSGTTDTLLASDIGGVVEYTSSSDITVTVPSGLPLGVIALSPEGTGQITVAGDGTMVPTGTPTLLSRTRYSPLAVRVRSSTSCRVTGDLAAPP